jgi:hypothetical protein
LLVELRLIYIAFFIMMHAGGHAAFPLHARFNPRAFDSRENAVPPQWPNAISFWEFATTTVRGETSFFSGTLNWFIDHPRYKHIWEKRLAGNTTIQDLQYYLYVLVKYMHRYPACPLHAMPDVLTTRIPSHKKGGGTIRRGMSRSTFRKRCLSIAREIEAVLESTGGEFEFSRRLSPFNHTPVLGANFTSVWDTCPFEISTPVRTAVFHRTYNGKDKNNAFKAMFGFTFTGLPIAEYGLCQPKVYDAHIMQRIDLHPSGRTVPHQAEMRVGDGHFSTAVRFLAPPRKPTGGYFDVVELAVYRLVQLVRSPVEQGMRQMKLTGMFQCKYRGNYSDFQTYYKVGVHMRARDMYIKADAGHPFRRGFGPFSHF